MSFKQLAIIAPTASGKTDLSISLAKKIDAAILSLDSLSVYKQIDIASAKPTIKERCGIKHFGIDIFEPDVSFDVIAFIDEYKKAKKYCLENKKNLIIVGGTSFYLKVLIDGISKTAILTDEIKIEVDKRLEDLDNSYNLLYSIDKEYMEKIGKTDRYRIQKILELYYSTNKTPTQYFKENKPIPIVENLQVFAIKTDTQVLRDRIKLRTSKMIQSGIIDEVIALEKRYTREPNSMQSIGIKETLDYLDGKIDKKELQELISIHTAQLAKRQRTFNRSQFNGVIEESLERIENKILNMI